MESASSFYTFEITCSPNRTAAIGGVCSATPCRSSFFALRTIHFPDGTSAPAGFQCVTLNQATPSPGITQPPVDLQVGASVVHARFRVVEYRWAFGDGQGLVTTGPGTRGLDSEVRTAFRRRGHYRVGVTVVWAAEAFLDGRRVGQVDELVSAAQTTYPVAEIRTILTG
jgi:hypothetical protein